MATLLYRLGRFSARRHWLVLAVWAVLLAVLGGLAYGVEKTAATDTSFSIPGTEASEGLDLVEEKFSAGANDATATVVFQAPAGQTLTTAENAGALQGVLAQLRGIEGVVSVSDLLAPQTPMVSRDQTIASSTVTFDGLVGDVTPEQVEALQAATDHDAGPVRVEMTSQVVTTEAGHTSEAIGVAVAALVLVLTYGALAAAGANLLTAGIGVGAGILGITALGNVVSLSATTPALAGMLGLAVGIDYALFVFARTRTELRRGVGLDQAIAKATGTAGTAVVFAGTTVVIALVGLSVVNIPFLTQMGLAAAATVAIAVVVALTAVPAFLKVLGLRVLPKKERHRDPAGLRAAAESDDHALADLAGPGLLGRWARGVTGHPVLALLAAVVLVGAVAIPVASMRTALPSAENDDPASSSRQAYDLLVQGFGPGSQSTLIVLVNGDDAAAVATAAGEVATRVQGLDDVAAVLPGIPSADGTAQLITVVPASGPTDEKTSELVRDLRSATSGTDGAEVLVTGQTALDIDVTDSLNDALPVYIALIVVLALFLLIMLFRSLAVPLLATVGFLLSLGASLGAVVAIYQWGWLSDVFGVAQPAPLLSFMPVLVVGILFGLAMDYQMFLVSAIHEQHAHGRRPKDAVLAGFRRSGPVVVAAALIMSGVFVGFATSGDQIIGSIGMALTVGVLADALVVRMVIMPAALTLLGDAAWWMPRWMQRLVPNVDAEGRSLEALLAAGDTGATATATAPATAAEAAPSRADSPAEVPVPREERRHPVDPALAATPHGMPAEQRVARVAADLPLGIVGLVTDPAGHPLAGAALTITDQAGRQVARAGSDEVGLYELPLTAGGTFVLIVAAAEARPAAHLVAVSDRTVRHDVRLVGNASLHGVLTGADGTQPVGGGVLTLLDVRGDVVATTRSDASGHYRFGDLVAGSYVLSVLGESFRPVAQAVEVGPGADLAVDVRLSHGGRLIGQVSAGSDGRGVPEASVTLVDDGGAVVDSATTDTGGSFHFDDLSQGRYTLTAAGHPPVATAVEVEEGGHREVTVELGGPRRADGGPGSPAAR
ncbi:RND superfamily putative drug exporter [Kineococcus radiotolerans]|uniref:RND superfamily putative drug exporter n=1 Tax=Kineococcus radiotolerans TaxID=131568 RepID=A0A7W4XXV1_KINRA|nr:MMPL family transporter [Kineococcus radiotolerans]MBB2902461.1 RND superfamily putative drug exporter [Kineococcus radiotolerans]